MNYFELILVRAKRFPCFERLIWLTMYLYIISLLSNSLAVKCFKLVIIFFSAKMLNKQQLLVSPNMFYDLHLNTDDTVPLFQRDISIIHALRNLCTLTGKLNSLPTSGGPDQLFSIFFQRLSAHVYLADTAEQNIEFFSY